MIDGFADQDGPLDGKFGSKRLKMLLTRVSKMEAREQQEELLLIQQMRRMRLMKLISPQQFM